MGSISGIVVGSVIKEVPEMELEQLKNIRTDQIQLRYLELLIITDGILHGRIVVEMVLSLIS